MDKILIISIGGILCLMYLYQYAKNIRLYADLEVEKLINKEKFKYVDFWQNAYVDAVISNKSISSDVKRLVINNKILECKLIIDEFRKKLDSGEIK